MAMRRKLRPGYSRPANWRIEYEEGPATDVWVYKWSGAPARDDAWHEFSPEAHAAYRFTRGRLQTLRATTRIGNAAWRCIFEAFQPVKPLLDDGVEELRICACDGRLSMWSIWLPEEHAVKLTGLTRGALLDALARVRERAEELRRPSQSRRSGATRHRNGNPHARRWSI